MQLGVPMQEFVGMLASQAIEIQRVFNAAHEEAARTLGSSVMQERSVGTFVAEMVPPRQVLHSFNAEFQASIEVHRQVGFEISVQPFDMSAAIRHQRSAATAVSVSFEVRQQPIRTHPESDNASTQGGE